ncbi:MULTISPECIES: NADH-quinone oxidoreductase subunit K [Methanohalophilus]|jgi:multicomponent Na+:H+ antiporter subunit C|uniref:Cation:proton antiporter n=1 Tax=Methanohalophilus euhalobius TaxID=51203 RepID=A0A314ZUB5_9EURY|nr:MULTISPECIES: NADH-quinone oxidoreductase subunit K [Methanohalophilus]KXS46975.1 MAG: multicomponent Na+:H+ antiporter subunit C [Methanohalophilus sp. T328-1]RSD34870.1 MAG: multicomponent Na+:H+ antiporter subunit C [Methanohalophilus sp.]OBZ36091.1 MAG: cation:proton antiporter [Methanohalophilus sp. DAL1]PQV42589.1 multisubunit sodium/proton antiporter MrpC subunit [Methanohalophilus euhalobius]RNI08627.1 cation:proton antiporter [Methanohalophilus euhalobius]
MNNTILSIAIALIFGVGTFLILRRDIIKIIIGLSLISHAVNMLIVSTGVFDGEKAPIITEGHHGSGSGIIFTDKLSEGILAPIVPSGMETPFVDPLVQALVLTAIVISLATTAFILILAYRIHEEYGTTDVRILRRLRG